MQPMQILSKLGQGSFGEVYKAQSSVISSPLALKFDRSSSNIKTPDIPLSYSLKKEAKILSLLSQDIGFPRLYTLGAIDSSPYMSMSLLGINLNRKLILNKNKLSMGLVSHIAVEAISRLESLHNKGYIHRDIKPENFVYGLKPNDYTVYLIDFGLAQKFKRKSGNHRIFCMRRGFVGTARYASINSHKGFECSRRDDLISLGYMIIYLAKGNLPWQNIDVKNKSEKLKIITEMKEKINLDEFCDELHLGFRKYMENVTKLKFEEDPDYHLLKSFFVRYANKRSSDCETSASIDLLEFEKNFKKVESEWIEESIGTLKPIIHSPNHTITPKVFLNELNNQKNTIHSKTPRKQSLSLYIKPLK